MPTEVRAGESSLAELESTALDVDGEALDDRVLESKHERQRQDAALLFVSLRRQLPVRHRGRTRGAELDLTDQRRGGLPLERQAGDVELVAREPEAHVLNDEAAEQRAVDPPDRELRARARKHARERPPSARLGRDEPERGARERHGERAEQQQSRERVREPPHRSGPSVMCSRHEFVGSSNGCATIDADRPERRQPARADAGARLRARTRRGRTRCRSRRTRPPTNAAEPCARTRGSRSRARSRRSPGPWNRSGRACCSRSRECCCRRPRRSEPTVAASRSRCSYIAPISLLNRIRDCSEGDQTHLPCRITARSSSRKGSRRPRRAPRARASSHDSRGSCCRCAGESSRCRASSSCARPFSAPTVKSSTRNVSIASETSRARDASSAARRSASCRCPRCPCSRASRRRRKRANRVRGSSIGIR